MNADKTVYLADDDDDDRYLFKEALEQTGENVRVIETESGEELIQKLKEADNLSKAVAIVDHNMPGMTGIDTIESIKAEPEIAHVNTVMMSTSSNPALASQAFEAGADLFVSKPFSFKGLVSIIKRVFDFFFK